MTFPLDDGQLGNLKLPRQTDLFLEEKDISTTLTQRLKKFSGSMIKQSIRRRIVAIAVGLIILMVATSVLSMVMVERVGHLLDELTARYIPANAHLTQITLLSLERGLALRRMVIAKMQEPPDVMGYRTQKQLYDAKSGEVDSEAQAARKLINAIIDDASTPSDNAALGRIDSRIESLMTDARRHLKQASGELISALDAQDFAAGRRILAQADFLRDELDGNIDTVRSELLKVSTGAIATIRLEQKQGGRYLGDCHPAIRDNRIDFRQPRQRRHHSFRPAIAGRYAGGRGWRP